MTVVAGVVCWWVGWEGVGVVVVVVVTVVSEDDA